MSYKFDPDLEFLSELTDEQLNPLVEILIKDENGKNRLTEALTSSAAYKCYAPHHHKYWREIAAEVQLFGANTIASIFRGGKGVLYREVLIDVAKKLKIHFRKDSSVENIEQNLLMKLSNNLDKALSPEQLKELLLSIDTSNLKYDKKIIALYSLLTGKSIFPSTIINPTILPYINSIKEIKTCVPVMTRTPPIFFVAVIGLSIASITSPAYRVTIPAVSYIAILRQIYKNKFNSN